MQEIQNEIQEIKGDLVIRRVILAIGIILIAFLLFFFSKAEASEFGTITSQETTSTWNNLEIPWITLPTSSIISIQLFPNGVSSSSINRNGFYLRHKASQNSEYLDCPFKSTTELPVLTDFSSSSNPYINATSTMFEPVCESLYVTADDYYLWDIKDDSTTGPGYMFLSWGNPTYSPQFYAYGFSDYTYPGNTSIQFTTLKNNQILNPFQYWDLSVLNYASHTIKIHYSTPYEDTIYSHIDSIGKIIKSTTTLTTNIWIPVANDLYIPELGNTTYWQAWAGAYNISGTLVAWTPSINFLIKDGNITTLPSPISYASSTSATSTDLINYGNIITFQNRCEDQKPTGGFLGYLGWDGILYGGCRLADILFTPMNDSVNFMEDNFNTLRSYYPITLVENILSPLLSYASNTSTPTTTLEISIPNVGTIPILSSSTISNQLGTNTKNNLINIETMIIRTVAIFTALMILIL